MPQQKHIHTRLKQKGQQREGMRGWQTTAIPIQKQKKHIMRTYDEYWAHACKNLLLDSWLSGAPGARHSLGRKNKYDTYISVFFLVQPVQTSSISYWEKQLTATGVVFGILINTGLSLTTHCNWALWTSNIRSAKGGCTRGNNLPPLTPIQSKITISLN